MSKVANCVLTVMFVLMIMVCTFMVIFAFCNHHITVLALKGTLQDIVQIAPLVSQERAGQISPEGKALLAELKSQSKTVMDSNTVSFLFQVLLLSVVTVAAYLLFRSHDALTRAQRNLEEAQRNLQQSEAGAKRVERGLRGTLGSIRPFFEGASSALAIAAHYSNIQQMVAGLHIATEEEREPLVPWIRESFSGLEERLNVAREDRHGIEPSLYDYFMLDVADKIEKNLELLPIGKEDREVSGIADLAARSRRCLDLLRGAKFKDWYNQNISGLGTTLEGGEFSASGS